MISSRGKGGFAAFILVLAAAAALAGCGRRERPMEEFPLTVSFRVNFFPVQKALWIEDADGNYLRTLHASEWLSGYGEEYGVLADWVEASREARAKKAGEQIDAYTEATLRAGREKSRYGWDMTDWQGRKIRDKEVRVILQCDGAEGVVIAWSAGVYLGNEPSRAEMLPDPPEHPGGLELYLEDVSVEYNPL